MVVSYVFFICNQYFISINFGDHGCVIPSQENKVYKLLKSLSSLKQASKQWHKKFDKILISESFLPIEVDKCVYTKIGKWWMCYYIYA